MGHFDVRSKLALCLRSGSTQTRPEQETIAQRANPQFTSALVQLPTEIKELIFEELWRDAGLSQHLILEGGRVVGLKCITDASCNTPEASSNMPEASSNMPEDKTQ
ncbi:hypothetical protein ACHAP8_005819 [Fusarium lateritium]